MIQNLLRRNLAASRRAFSTNNRALGRIFGNYDQQSSSIESNNNNFVDSPAPVETGRRYNNPNSNFNSNSNGPQTASLESPPSAPSSSFAFTEESLQDYSLSSFKGASDVPFSPEISNILAEPLDEQLIEIKPDGSCYLPEVHYRRILNKAFGLGGWTLIPRGAHSIQSNVISREYALFANGRYISQARGHATISGSFQNPAMCTESVRSNSLMRCCKDLGIASSLWDNSITAQWKAKYAIRKSVTDYQGRTKNIWEKKRQEQY